MSFLKQVLRTLVGVMVLLIGPAMFVLGQYFINIDEELALTGTQTTGIIVDFDDVNKASDRDIKVEFMSLDGAYHYTWAPVDHDQHPVVGEDVTVIYREQDPGHAIVSGYESQGVWLRGAGTVVTGILVLIGWFVAVPLLLGRFRHRKQAEPSQAAG
jgi:cytochrome c oxidase assembly protein Cox11